MPLLYLSVVALRGAECIRARDSLGCWSKSEVIKEYLWQPRKQAKRKSVHRTRRKLMPFGFHCDRDIIESVRKD